jgi:hypothetical protein
MSAFEEGSAQDSAYGSQHVDGFDRMHSEQGYLASGLDYETGVTNSANLHANIAGNTHTFDGIQGTVGLNKGYQHTDGTITSSQHRDAYRHDDGLYSHGDFSDHGGHGIRDHDKGSTTTLNDEEHDMGVAVAHHCLRYKDDGETILEIVPYGWTGVGHGQKYCFLEVCDVCDDPISADTSGLSSNTHLNSLGEDEHHEKEKRQKTDLYCKMTRKTTRVDNKDSATENAKSSKNGVCGVSRKTTKCEYVTCQYSPATGMNVTVSQIGQSPGGTIRQMGRNPETSPFSNGRQHECRPKRTSAGWDCNCHCFNDDPAVQPVLPSSGVAQAVAGQQA